MSLSVEQQITRLVVALIVGVIIGFERRYHGKPAGIRTHSIVSVVCTMLTIVAVYGFSGLPGEPDPSRIISNILTGVGFLAGGVIFSVGKDEQKTIHGLTTAAGVWGSACLGIPIGLGLFPIVFMTVTIIEFILALERFLNKHRIDRVSDEENDNS